VAHELFGKHELAHPTLMGDTFWANVSSLSLFDRAIVQDKGWLPHPS
jgi:hypothetical protein